MTGPREPVVRRAPDPLGKRALFWVPGTEEHPSGGARPTDRPLGKRALYSQASALAGVDDQPPPENPLAERGPFVVTCSSCEAVCRVGLVDFLLFQIPFGYWLPRGRYDRRMTCPSCRRRVWASVTLRRS